MLECLSMAKHSSLVKHLRVRLGAYPIRCTLIGSPLPLALALFPNFCQGWSKHSSLSGFFISGKEKKS
jgi:hypothetical protein